MERLLPVITDRLEAKLSLSKSERMPKVFSTISRYGLEIPNLANTSMPFSPASTSPPRVLTAQVAVTLDRTATHGMILTRFVASSAARRETSHIERYPVLSGFALSTVTQIAALGSPSALASNLYIDRFANPSIGASIRTRFSGRRGLISERPLWVESSQTARRLACKSEIKLASPSQKHASRTPSLQTTERQGH
jgi:hypothetical protein